MTLSNIPEIRERQLRAKELAGEKPVRKIPLNPQYAKPNYATMPLEDLKALEHKASDWLKVNKGHENFDSAMKRYKSLTHFLTLRMDI